MKSGSTHSEAFLQLRSQRATDHRQVPATDHDVAANTATCCTSGGHRVVAGKTDAVDHRLDFAVGNAGRGIGVTVWA